MKEVLLALPGIALTVLCWGSYGSILHKGQAGLGGDRLKPLICVGAAYFIVAIIVPVVLLVVSGKLGGDWTFSGISWALAAGAAGALGALGIILALTNGGKPIYVMPLVFGGAPIVNVFVSMWFANTHLKDSDPLRLGIFFAGMIMVAIGAVMVLVFQPKGKPHAAKPLAKQVVESTESAPSEDLEKPDEKGT